MNSSVALRIFNLIQGTWKVTRNITGAGHFNGVAKFEKIPTSASTANELEYSEHGVFYFDNGSTFDASKKYIYRYVDGDVYVYFTDRDELTGENKFFHKMNINKRVVDDLSSAGDGVWTFSATHLCSEDKYNVKYNFYVDNDNEFNIIYDVKGPNKNYVSNTTFNRIQN